MAHSVKITKAYYGRNQVTYLVQPNTGMDFEFVGKKLMSIYDSDRKIEIRGKDLDYEITLGRYRIAYQRSVEALDEYIHGKPAKEPVRKETKEMPKIPKTVKGYIVETNKTYNAYSTLEKARECAKKLYEKGERRIAIYRLTSDGPEYMGMYTTNKNLGVIKRF